MDLTSFNGADWLIITMTFVLVLATINYVVRSYRSAFEGNIRNAMVNLGRVLMMVGVTLGTLHFAGHSPATSFEIPWADFPPQFFISIMGIGLLPVLGVVVVQMFEVITGLLRRIRGPRPINLQEHGDSITVPQ